VRSPAFVALSVSIAIGVALAACAPAVKTTGGNGKPKPSASVSTSSPPGGGGGASSVCSACTSYGAVKTAGTITSAALDEVSGLASSRKNAGVLYTHNDSGDTARFFAIDEKGAMLAEYALPGAFAFDWEDIAVGPCDADSCVFLSDSGDNAKKRSDYSIYRVHEPTVPSSGAPLANAPINVTYDRITFVYPDGRHDAEALLVHPSTGELYLVTKSWIGSGTLYRFPMPLDPGAKSTLVKLGSVRLPSIGIQPITGGDIHPCGDRVAIRTYGAVLEYRVVEGAPWATILETEPRVIAEPNEPQGEAVAYRADGMALFTASEGKTPALHLIECE